MIDIEIEDFPGVVVLYIKGDFYLESIQYAEEIWDKQIAKKPGAIGINFSYIRFIDSSAIGILVKFLNDAIKLNIELVFFDLSKSIVSVFKTARLSNFFKIMTKEEFEKKYNIL